MNLILLPMKFPQRFEYSSHVPFKDYLLPKSEIFQLPHNTQCCVLSTLPAWCSLYYDYLAILSTLKHRAVLCLSKCHRKTFISGSEVKLEHFLNVCLSLYLHAVQCAKSKTSSCHLTTKIASHNHQKFA